MYNFSIELSIITACFTPLHQFSGDGLEMMSSHSTLNRVRHFYRLDVLAPEDGDGDGLSAIEEAMLGTNPAVKDTDGDELEDGDEVNELVGEAVGELVDDVKSDST